MSDREDLRRRLRDKIKNKREGTSKSAAPQLAQRMKADPASAMLSMGIDDPGILRQANSILKNPEGFLKSLAADMNSKDAAEKKPSGSVESGLSDDEEAPPP